MKKEYLWLSICIPLCILSRINSSNTDIFKALTETLNTYEKNEHPRYKNNSLVYVEVAFIILSFSSISVIDMDYTLNIELKQRWMDARLKLPSHEGLYNIVKFKDQIWRPDVYFRNSKDGSIHIVPVPKELLKLDVATGMIVFTQTMSIKLSCDMNLWKFPMDVQYCFINIGSYSYIKKQLKLRWWLSNGIYGYYPKNNQTLDFTSAINVHENLKMNEFETPVTNCCFCKNETTDLGAFPCLTGVFKLERKYGFYITYVYIPSLMVLLVCWLSFFIDYTSAPARVSICVFSILSIISQGSTIVNTLPKVSYPKAIDWWIFSCFSLVILSFIEYVLVNYYHGQRLKEKTPSRFYKLTHAEPIQVERIFRMAFPILVIILVITYWSFYLSAANGDVNCNDMVTKSKITKVEDF